MTLRPEERKESAVTNEELAKALYLSDLGGWSKLPGSSWENVLEETRDYWRERAASLEPHLPVPRGQESSTS